MRTFVSYCIISSAPAASHPAFVLLSRWTFHVNVCSPFIQSIASVIMQRTAKRDSLIEEGGRLGECSLPWAIRFTPKLVSHSRTFLHSAVSAVENGPAAPIIILLWWGGEIKKHPGWFVFLSILGGPDNAPCKNSISVEIDLVKHLHFGMEALKIVSFFVKKMPQKKKNIQRCWVFHLRHWTIQTFLSKTWHFQVVDCWHRGNFFP